MDPILNPHFKIAISVKNYYETNEYSIYSSEQQCYINLLKRYLQTIYDETLAESTFYKLMDQLKITTTVSEVHIKAYFDVNTSQIEETGIGSLLMEIFDLNSRHADIKDP